MPRPNALGRAFRYFTDALEYASAPFGARKARHPVLRSVFESVRYTSGSSEADEDQAMRLAATNPHVYDAVRTISNRVAESGNLLLQQRDANRQWRDVDDHPFLDLLSRPNSLMPGSLLLNETAWWLNLLGNAYWFLATSEPGQGPVQEIWPLPANSVSPDPESLRISPFTGKATVDYIYSLAGQEKTLPGENVVHFRTANPFDYWKGLSPLSSLMTTLDTHYAQAAWLASFFDEGNAVPTAIISLPPEIDDVDFDMMKQDIIEQFGARRRAAITRAGDMEVQILQHSIEDMQVIDGLSYNATEVRRVYQIPEGLASASSGQARLAAEAALARDAIQPLLNYLAEVISLSVLPFYEGGSIDLQCTAKSVVPQDRALEASEYASYGADRTMNENREIQGLKPLAFSGALAGMQALLDEVPRSMVDILAQVMMGAEGGGVPGAPGSDQEGQQILAELTGREPAAIVDEMTGQSTVEELAGKNPQATMAEMTGSTLVREMTNESPASPDGANQQASGQPTQQQVLNQLLGKDPVADVTKKSIEWEKSIIPLMSFEEEAIRFVVREKDVAATMLKGE